MRLLTHNTLRNNSDEANGKGFPLKITAIEVRVDDNTDNNVANDNNDQTNSSEQQQKREIAFVKGILGILDWPALIRGASQMGLTTLPPTLSEELVTDPTFLRALYHVLMNVHLVKGMVTCPTTGREFPVTDGIVNFMLEEEECENVRY